MEAVKEQEAVQIARQSKRGEPTWEIADLFPHQGQ